MAALTIDRLDGFVGEDIRYHFDVRSDVMYVRLADKMQSESYGEEMDDGLIVLRTLANDELVGVTVVGYWERFGSGRVEDTPVIEVVAGVQKVAEKVLRPAA
jgi:hypothetical protein